jgi:hypothetical protein
MYNLKEFNQNRTKFNLRSNWITKKKSFAVPYFSIANPLEQCRFVMTQLDSNNQPYPVNMWGNTIDPKIHGTTNFYNAESLWLIGQGIYFDGYSIVLGDLAEQVFVNDDNYYIVGGIYPNGLNLERGNYKISPEVMADLISLDFPLYWHTPDWRGVCWVGLSPTPIIGGKNSTKHISSVNLTLPITAFALRDNVTPYSTEDKDYLTVLPSYADRVINKWFI